MNFEQVDAGSGKHRSVELLLFMLFIYKRYEGKAKKKIQKYFHAKNFFLFPISNKMWLRDLWVILNRRI